ncbi:hypothetical protein ACQYAD_17650 [Neobacillus sp. SM06]|uniref:hypothetical protein n=1 Tax=Neobacillus sp. SM06 TaxID=3422492 RepID=UPI003D27E854
MRKKFIIFSLIVAIALIIAVTTFNKVKVLSLDHNLTKVKNLYIDTADNLNHFLYKIKIDANTKEKKLLLKRPVQEAYPTSAYSEKNNRIYFSKSIENKSTQLFEKDLNNNQTKQLTKDLNFIDFLSLNRSKQLIYIRALVGNTDRNFHIATYNLLTSKYEVWNPHDSDTSVVWFDYNAKANKILAVTKSIKEEFENIDKANKTKTAPIPPVYKISLYTEDGNLEKEVLVLKKFVRSAALSDNGKTILINYKDGIEPNKPSIVAKYSIDRHSLKPLLQDSKQIFNIRNPIYDQKNNGYYFIADDNPIGSSSSVKYFNFKTNEIKQVFHTENEVIIKIYINN